MQTITGYLNIALTSAQWEMYKRLSKDYREQGKRINQEVIDSSFPINERIYLNDGKPSLNVKLVFQDENEKWRKTKTQIIVEGFDNIKLLENYYEHNRLVNIIAYDNKALSISDATELEQGAWKIELGAENIKALNEMQNEKVLNELISDIQHGKFSKEKISDAPIEQTNDYGALTDDDTLVLHKIDPKVEELVNMANEGIANDYSNFLSMVNRFPKYSTKNTSLISAQTHGEATMVKPYNAWKKENVQVLRGEKGISIWLPTKSNIVKSRTGSYIMSESKARNNKEVMAKIRSGEYKIESNATFVLKPVLFDISQTNANIQEIENEITNDQFHNYLKELAREYDIEVAYSNVLSGALGKAQQYSNGKQRIVLDTNLSTDELNQVFLHEIAHIKLGHFEEIDKTHEQQEFEAETLSYLLSDNFGFANRNKSAMYLSHVSTNVISELSSKGYDEIHEIITHMKKVEENILADLKSVIENNSVETEISKPIKSDISLSPALAFNREQIYKVPNVLDLLEANNPKAYLTENKQEIVYTDDDGDIKHLNIEQNTNEEIVNVLTWERHISQEKLLDKFIELNELEAFNSLVKETGETLGYLEEADGHLNFQMLGKIIEIETDENLERERIENEFIQIYSRNISVFEENVPYVDTLITEEGVIFNIALNGYEHEMEYKFDDVLDEVDITNEFETIITLAQEYKLYLEKEAQIETPTTKQLSENILNYPYVSIDVASNYNEKQLTLEIKQAIEKAYDIDLSKITNDEVFIKEYYDYTLSGDRISSAHNDGKETLVDNDTGEVILNEFIQFSIPTKEELKVAVEEELQYLKSEKKYYLSHYIIEGYVESNEILELRQGELIEYNIENYSSIWKEQKKLWDHGDLSNGLIILSNDKDEVIEYIRGDMLNYEKRPPISRLEDCISKFEKGTLFKGKCGETRKDMYESHKQNYLDERNMFKYAPFANNISNEYYLSYFVKSENKDISDVELLKFNFDNFESLYTKLIEDYNREKKGLILLSNEKNEVIHYTDENERFSLKSEFRTNAQSIKWYEDQEKLSQIIMINQNYYNDKYLTEHAFKWIDTDLNKQNVVYSINGEKGEVSSSLFKSIDYLIEFFNNDYIRENPEVIKETIKGFERTWLKYDDEYYSLGKLERNISNAVNCGVYVDYPMETWKLEDLIEEIDKTPIFKLGEYLKTLYEENTIYDYSSVQASVYFLENYFNIQFSKNSDLLEVTSEEDLKRLAIEYLDLENLENATEKIVNDVESIMSEVGKYNLINLGQENELLAKEEELLKTFDKDTVESYLKIAPISLSNNTYAKEIMECMTEASPVGKENIEDIKIKLGLMINELNDVLELNLDDTELFEIDDERLSLNVEKLIKFELVESFVKEDISKTEIQGKLNELNDKYDCDVEMALERFELNKVKEVSKQQCESEKAIKFSNGKAIKASSVDMEY